MKERERARESESGKRKTERIRRERDSMYISRERERERERERVRHPVDTRGQTERKRKIIGQLRLLVLRERERLEDLSAAKGISS